MSLTMLPKLFDVIPLSPLLYWCCLATAPLRAAASCPVLLTGLWPLCNLQESNGLIRYTLPSMHALAGDTVNCCFGGWYKCAHWEPGILIQLRVKVFAIYFLPNM